MSSNKQFGFFLTVLFIIFSIYFYFTNTTNLAIILLSVSIPLFILSIYFPSVFSLLNYAWYKLGIFLGLIFSPIIMGLIFYILISPLSILLRIAGRDELSLKMSPKIKSYWVNKNNDIDDKIDFNKQF